jgi:hypothetical protein
MGRRGEMAATWQAPDVRRRIAIGLAGVVVLVVATQIALPPIAEDRISDRLTEDGGSAQVSLSAFPALRLAFSDGDRLAVDADGVDLELPSEPGSLSKLDGFEDVDIQINESSAGPFQLASVGLTRDGPGPYRFTLRGATSTNALIDFGADQLGFLGGTALRFLGRQALPDDQELPMRFDMQLSNEGGRLRVVSGGGMIAGIPTGPLAELITSALVIRL